MEQGLWHFMGSSRGGHKSNRNTHINEKKYRRLRSQKTVEIELEEYEEQTKLKSMSPEEVRLALLKKGINPYKEITPRDWQEQQLTQHSFYSTLDPYLPPEVGGSWTQLGEKKDELKERAKHRFYNYWHGVRRIKKKAGFEKFSVKDFCSTAEEIYGQAHKALVERNEPILHKYITENAFAKMWPDVQKGSVLWELVRFNSPSKVVSVRCADNPSKSGNDIAQLTVRMHITQKLAIYDRFGSLILGSTEEPKECLEYVIFENHISSLDGRWRVHDKIYPHWSEPKQALHSTAFRAAIDAPKLKPSQLHLGFAQRMEREDKKYSEDKRTGVRK